MAQEDFAILVGITGDRNWKRLPLIHIGRSRGK